MTADPPVSGAATSQRLVTPELEPLLERVRYVPKRVAHHAQHSGYDTLFAACEMRQARSRGFVRLAKMVPRQLAWRLWALRPQPSHQAGLEAELGALPWTALGRGRLCHFIYGEDTFFFTPLWKRSRNRCVATFHYPPAMLSRRVNPGSLKTLDAAIIVGENQREWLAECLPPERIHFCPHHVDTEFFSPGDVSARAPALRLVCVGQLFRDYDSLMRVLRLLRSYYRWEIELDIIGLQHAAHPIADEPGVNIHRRIDDEALRNVYRRAAVGVLPLTDSTANNTLLEMMAAGLPIVVSDVGGVPSYAQSGGVVRVAHGDAERFAVEVHTLLADSQLRAEHGEANRTYAVRELSLPACARRLATIYGAVMS